MNALHAFRRRNLERIRATRLVTGICAGKPDRSAYAAYLVNVYHYARYSPSVIALAASRCTAWAAPLTAYLIQHAAEELGHDAWAHADLRDLGMSEQQIERSRPSPSCAAMIGYEYFLAGHGNPVALFGWLFALESLGDEVATLVARGLEEGLGLGGKATSFLRGHGEADHAHTRDLATQIRENVTEPSDLDDILEAAEVSSVLYARLIDEGAGPEAP